MPAGERPARSCRRPRSARPSACRTSVVALVRRLPGLALAQLGLRLAIATSRRRMKSSWIGIGFSHHRVPSLSNVAIRSSGAARTVSPAPYTDRRSSTIASLVGPVATTASGVRRHAHRRSPLLPHQHRAASRSRSMYGSPLTSTATRRIVPPVKRHGCVARVVLGDAGAAVAPDAEALAGDHELAGLGLDAALADLGLAVPEREHPGGDAGRVLAVLVERRRRGSGSRRWAGPGRRRRAARPCRRSCRRSAAGCP